MAISPQFIRTESGDELVVLTRAEFDRLTAGLGEEAEEAADTALAAERLADLAQGRDMALPPEVSSRLLRGDSLLRALRKWRGMTQLELSCRVGLGQGYLSDIETGRRSGTRETLASIASVLEVEPSWLT